MNFSHESQENSIQDRIDSALEILKNNIWVNRNFDLSTLKFIGKGSFGFVFSIFHRNFKRQIALKIITSQKEELNQVIEELIKMKTLKHPNILEILDFRIIIHGKTLFLLLVMEEGLMSMAKYLEDNPKGLLEKELCEITEVLTSAIIYAHQQRIVHCDLKPGNIILFQKDIKVNKSESLYCVKIADWGSGYEFKEYNNSKAMSVKSGMAFTSLYLAPDLHIFEEGEEKVGKGNFFAGDIYALGITLLRCVGIKMKDLGGLSGEQDEEIYEIKLKKIMNQLNASEISPETLNKIEKMIKYNSNDRVVPLGNKLSLRTFPPFIIFHRDTEASNILKEAREKKLEDDINQIKIKYGLIFLYTFIHSFSEGIDEKIDRLKKK